MTDIGTRNPFAPPRASVEDTVLVDTALVDATRGSRLLAYLVDIAPVFVAGIVGVIAAVALPAYAKGHPGASLGTQPLLMGFAVVCALAMVAWAIWNIVLLYRHGQTIGKRALGLRTVRTDGSRVTFARFFFLRGLPLAVLGGVVAKIAGPAHPLANYLVVIVDSLVIFQASRRCIHDLIADTRVVTAKSSPYATLAGASGAHLPTIAF